jgi:hypothetical protein
MLQLLMTQSLMSPLCLAGLRLTGDLLISQKRRTAFLGNQWLPCTAKELP